MAKFTDELQAALNRFDIHRAEALADKLHAAEETGYELNATEDKLLVRLLKCIESFRRTMYSLD